MIIDEAEDKEIDEEMMIVEVEDDTDHEQEDINDPKPSCRNTILEKSKKKKKKKGSAMVRSYDEIIESGVMMSMILKGPSPEI